MVNSINPFRSEGTKNQSNFQPDGRKDNVDHAPILPPIPHHKNYTFGDPKPSIPGQGTGTHAILLKEDYSIELNLHLPPDAKILTIEGKASFPIPGGSTNFTHTFSPVELANQHTFVTIPGLSPAVGVVKVSPAGGLIDYPFQAGGSLYVPDEHRVLPTETFTYKYVTSTPPGQIKNYNSFPVKVDPGPTAHTHLITQSVVINNVPDDTMLAVLNTIPQEGKSVTIHLINIDNESDVVGLSPTTAQGVPLSGTAIGLHDFSIVIPSYKPGDSFTYTLVSTTDPASFPVDVHFGGGLTTPQTVIHGSGHAQVMIGGLNPNGISILNANSTSAETGAPPDILGEGGKSNLIGVAGTNLFVVNDATICSVQGAANGTNTLYWNNDSQMDIHQIRNYGTVFLNLDKIDIGSKNLIPGGIHDVAFGKPVELSVGLSDVLAITHASGPNAHSLYITGSHDDTVALENVMGTPGGILPNGWQDTHAHVSHDGTSFESFINIYDASVHLYVQVGMTVI